MDNLLIQINNIYNKKLKLNETVKFINNKIKPRSIFDMSQHLPYKNWNDITPTEFEERRKNAVNNMYTNLNYFFNTDWKLMESKIKQDGICLYTDDIHKANYFEAEKAYLKSYYSLNIVGNVVLTDNIIWKSGYSLDTSFTEPFNYKYNRSLDIDKNTEIVFNYTTPPSANHYDPSQLNKYYMHMKSAIRLGMIAMYDHYRNSPKTKVLIWNPFGLGAFIKTFKGDKEQIKNQVIKILFEVYRDGSFPNSVLVFVGKGIISDQQFEGIYQEVFKNIDLQNSQKSLIIASGDMLNIALEYKNKGNDVAITMAADTIGPGNRFFQMPIGAKEGRARQASDENNTRRSNIIWKVLYLNLKCVIEKEGRKSISSRDLEEIGSKINNAYKKRRNCDLYDVVRDIDITKTAMLS
jgi:hypothetical protein